MRRYTEAERREWMAWHSNNGRNVAATARHFRIPRSTLYRWLARYDDAHPRRSLRDQPPPRRDPRLSLLELKYFATVLDLIAFNPRWGRGRIQIELAARYGHAPSLATIGRWLAEINRSCPLCAGRAGKHQVAVHIFRRDLDAMDLARRLRTRRSRKPRNRPRIARDAIDGAERIIRKATRRYGGGDAAAT